MNHVEEASFYREALEMRNLDQMTLDLILRAEGLNTAIASVDRCRDAVIKYQYLDDDDTWEWQTDHKRLIGVIREKQKLEAAK